MIFKPSTLEDLLSIFGGDVVQVDGSEVACAEITLTGFAPLSNGTAGKLSFLSNKKLQNGLLETACSVVLVRADQLDELLAKCREGDNARQLYLWAVKDPYLAYAKIQQWWVSVSLPAPSAGVHPNAVVANSARISDSAIIEPGVVIEEDVTIHDGVRVKAGSFIGRGTVVGANTLINPNVTIYHECIVGSDCIIHSGAVIGADGFGFANEKGQWVKIPQVGRVVIADQVEVGANTTIDRGALEDTLIGFGVKLDNQIMVAHNVTIGDHTALAGCVGIAGSTHIGARCTIGGAAMLLGHLSIPDGTHVSGASAVMSTIKEPGAYSGIFPLDTHKAWEKTAVTLKQLTELRQRIRALEKKQNH